MPKTKVKPRSTTKKRGQKPRATRVIVTNRMKKVGRLKSQGKSLLAISRKLGIPYNTVKQDWRALCKYSGRPKLTPKKIEIAHKMNKAFDLRRKRMSEFGIADALDISPSSAGKYIGWLSDSVGEKTAKSLEEVTCKKLRKNYKLLPIGFL